MILARADRTKTILIPDVMVFVCDTSFPEGKEKTCFLLTFPLRNGCLCRFQEIIIPISGYGRILREKYYRIPALRQLP
jgi:hypothetical protein